MQKEKTCKDCNQTLPITMFRQSTFWTCKRKIKKSISTSRRCNKCEQAKVKKRYAEDPKFRENKKQHSINFYNSLEPEERKKRNATRYLKYKEKDKARRKKQYEEDPEKFRARNRANYALHAKKRVQEKQKYRKNNPKAVKLSSQKYYTKNKEKVLKQDKLYKQKNRARYNQQARNKYANCLQFKFKSNLHNRINGALRYNTKSDLSLKLLGTDDLNIVWQHFEKRWFKIYKTKLQKKDFIAGLLHVDHIIPCKSFDLRLAKEQQKCFHYTNLQLLYASDNCSKGAKLNWQQAA